MRYVKNNMGIADKQKLEVLGMEIADQAIEQEKQAAKLDYIAMMADVDLADVILEDEDAPEGGMPHAE